MEDQPGALFELFTRSFNTTGGKAERKSFAEETLKNFGQHLDNQPRLFGIANGLFMQAIGCYVYGFYDACAVMLRDALDAAILYASNYERAYIDGKGIDSWSPKPGEFVHTHTNINLAPALMKKINAKWDYLEPKANELKRAAIEDGTTLDVDEIKRIRDLGSFAAHLAEAGIKAFAEYIRRTPDERATFPPKNITIESEARTAIEKTCAIICKIKSIYTLMYPEKNDAGASAAQS